MRLVWGAQGLFDNWRNGRPGSVADASSHMEAREEQRCGARSRVPAARARQRALGVLSITVQLQFNQQKPYGRIKRKEQMHLLIFPLTLVPQSRKAFC